MYDVSNFIIPGATYERTEVKAIEGVKSSPRMTAKWKKETSVTNTGEAFLW